MRPRRRTVFSDEIKKQIFEQANAILSKDYPHLYATEYMMFRKNGKISVTDCFTLKENGTAAFNLITRVYPVSITENSFEIEGREVRFDRSLSFDVAEIICNTTETANLPKTWRTEKLWRVTLSAPKLTGNKNYKFKLEIR